MRERTRDLGATVVLSPALGGIVIGQEVGRALGVRAIFAERQDGALMLRRGFALAETDRVLVVEDVRDDRRLHARNDAGGQGGRRAGRRRRRRSSTGAGHACGLDVPFTALLDIALPTYEPDACPLCAQGVAGRQARFEASGGLSARQD